MKSIDKFVLVLVASLALLLAGCGGGSSTPEGPTPEEVAAMKAMEMRAMEQKADLEEAHEALTTALAATLNTQDALDAANAAHKTLSDAITAAADVSAADKAKYENAASAAMDRIADAQKIFDAAEAERMAMEQEQQRKEEAAAAAEMAATAAKLYAGIGSAPLTSTGDGQRSAAYSGTNDATITLTIDDAAVGDGTDVTQILTEDKKTMVAANHGWEGKRYTASGTGVNGTYEAIVYSNVGESEEGDPFNEEYTLTDGALAIDTSAAATPASRVASARFDQSAGLKRFKLPTPNPSGVTRITVSGSYHGVSGTYTCTPGDGNTCVSRVAADGFDLGVVDAGGTFTVGSWSFAPSTATAKVMSVADAHYASYGWWIHTDEDGKLTVSAFVDDKDDGTEANVPVAAGITALQGTATYSGGAAGKYALSSSTGGTNDAGHFTARATLQADFGDDMITGTINNFMGADGMSRNWSVELMEQTITDGGLINGTDGAGAGGASMTKWTIGETAGSAAGQWTGSLQVNGDDGVPKVGTGTFHSTYGSGNSMVGAFGVNKE